MLQEQTTLDYYDVGTPDNPVVSNSSMSRLNPEQGGSIQKFLKCFEQKEEKEEKEKLKEGKLLHRYMEKPEQFTVSEVEKPGGMLGDLCEALFINIDTVKALPSAFTSTDIEIRSNLKSEAGRSAEILATRDAYSNLASLVQINESDLIAAFRRARISGNFYTSYTDEGKVVAKVINEGLPYLKELSNTKGKIILDKKTKQAVEGAVTSLYTNRKIATLLQLGDAFDINSINCRLFSELPIYWQEKVTVLGNDSVDLRINAKAKLDKVKIDFTSKIIYLIDLKSTAYPISLYMNSFVEYRTYRQLAYYVKALSQWFKAVYPDLNIGDFKLVPLVIAVETGGLFESCIYEVSYPWIYKGKQEYINLLKRFAWHKHTGEFQKSYEEATSENGYLQFPNPKD